MLLREEAPAKLNLLLHVGPARGDELHPLCSLFASIDLADELHGRLADQREDSVECEGVAGPNLTLTAIERFRRDIDPGLGAVSLRIDKRIPVAAGLGGGSADAAAALRIVNRLAGGPLDQDGLRTLAAELGSDVPSQVQPGHALVWGVGERVEPVELPPLSALLVPEREGLSTAAVYAEFDALGGGRVPLELEPLRAIVHAAADDPVGLAGALENDLQPAALSLRPELEGRLDGLMAAGALGAAVTGSGPTCFGLFADRNAAQEAAAALPGSIVSQIRQSRPDPA